MLTEKQAWSYLASQIKRKLEINPNAFNYDVFNGERSTLRSGILALNIHGLISAGIFAAMKETLAKSKEPGGLTNDALCRRYRLAQEFAGEVSPNLDKLAAFTYHGKPRAIIVKKDDATYLEGLDMLEGGAYKKFIKNEIGEFGPTNFSVDAFTFTKTTVPA